MAIDISENNFKANFITFAIIGDQMLSILYSDMLLILASLSFVFIYFWVHLGSKLLAAVGGSIIVLSFPISAVIV